METELIKRIEAASAFIKFLSEKKGTKK